MSKKELGLQDHIGRLPVRCAVSIPNRRRLTQLLRDTLMPVCQSFYEDAGATIATRPVLDEFPTPEVTSRSPSPDNPAVAAIPDSPYYYELAPNTNLGMPIGDYGVDFGLTLWYATRQLVKDWRNYVERNPSLTIATCDSDEYLALSVSAFQRIPGEIICEGIQSVGQALCQLTSCVFPGFEGRPDLLLEAILQSGVINDYTNLLTFSDLGTRCRNGEFHSVPPLTQDSSGLLRVSPELREELWPNRQHAAIEWREGLADYRDVHAAQGEAQRGAGCPGRYGPIDLLAALLVKQTAMIIHGRARVPEQALKAMSEQGYKTFSISTPQNSGAALRQCPVHAGII